MIAYFSSTIHLCLWKNLRIGGDRLGESIQVVKIVVEAKIMMCGHAEGVEVEKVTMDIRHEGWVFQVVLWAATMSA